MRDLYDRLMEEGEVGIDRLIAEKTQESLQLDFKRKEVDRNGEFSTNDRQVLAKALSGFANSAGGLLVIGVDARPGPDRIDCAQASRPIADIRRFLADAQTEIGQLVQPRLDGVSLGAIECSSAPGSGYLLVHVERSERRPHRSEAKGQKGYFKRHGSSFFEMEHYDIEDAFSRSSSATLDVKMLTHRIWQSEKECEFGLRIYLLNTSNFIAKFPYIVFEKVDGAVLPAADQPRRLQSGLRHQAAMGGVDDVIHPGTERYMAMLKVVLKKNEQGKWMFTASRDGRSLSLELLYGCEDGRAMKYVSSSSPIMFDCYDAGFGPPP
ncbi:helix-turn-helix domain-containing protein [Methylobacterium sp. C33D]